MDSIGAVVVFGILFAICLIGLFWSNSASERLSNARRVDAADNQRANAGNPASGLR